MHKKVSLVDHGELLFILLPSGIKDSKLQVQQSCGRRLFQKIEIKIQKRPQVPFEIEKTWPSQSDYFPDPQML